MITLKRFQYFKHLHDKHHRDARSSRIHVTLAHNLHVTHADNKLFLLFHYFDVSTIIISLRGLA